MKRLIKLLIPFIVGIVSGGGALLVLEFIQGGGTVEEVKAYINVSVVPSAVQAVATLLALYIGSRPKLNEIEIASNGLLKATEVISSVSSTGAKTSTTAEEMNKRLQEQIEQNAALQDQITALNHRIDVAQKMIATGFGNLPELVKSGNARKVYKIMEEGEKDETEG